MAKIQLSALLTAAAGSTGGLTFSTGPSGPFVSKKTVQLNRPSPASLGIRSGFAQLSKRWANVLTEGEQAGWTALAAAHQIQNSLGQLITLTGIEYYMRLNSSLKSAQQPTIDTAPAYITPSSPGLITVTAQEAGPPTLTVTPTSNPAGGEVPIVWSMRPTRIGNNSPLKSLRIMKAFAPGTAGPYAVLTEWNIKFGLLQTSQVIICALQYTDAATGFVGTKSVNSTIAT